MLEGMRSRIDRTLHSISERVPRPRGTADDLRELRESVHVEAPPSVVFETIADPEKPFVTSNPLVDVTVVGEQSAGVGTVYRWTFDVPFGSSLALEEVVTDWVEDERFGYRATSGWPVEAVNTLHPEGNGTSLTSTFRYRLPGTWRWVLPRRFVRFGIREVLRKIRLYAEAGDDRRDGPVRRLIEFAVDVDAPPEEVFAVVSDPRSKLLWVPAIRRIRLGDRAIAAGTRYTASSGIGPFEFEFAERIVTLEEPNRVVYEGRSRWGEFRTTWDLTRVGEGTRAEYRMDYWLPETIGSRPLGRLVAAIVRPWMSRQTRQRIRTVVENSMWPTGRGADARE